MYDRFELAASDHIGGEVGCHTISCVRFQGMTETSGTYVKEISLALLLYVVAALLLTYPLALHPSSHSRLDNADAQLNAWAISWVANEFLRHPLEYFRRIPFIPCRTHWLSRSTFSCLESSLLQYLLSVTISFSRSISSYSLESSYRRWVCTFSYTG